MGFYGNTHELSLNDYFQSFKLKRAYTDDGKSFPADGAILGNSEMSLTAVVPAQDVVIATGNKWIQFVVDNDNAGMNNSDDIAYGLTLYHKKADGTVTGKMIDFANAVLKDGSNTIYADQNNTIPYLGYGKIFSINSVEFDEAGHAKGTVAGGALQYALPKVITSSEYTTIKQNYNDNKTSDVNAALKLEQPLSAKSIFNEHMTLLNDSTYLKGVVGESETAGLRGSVKQLTEDVGNIEDNINSNILPALGQTEGLRKPGIEFDNDDDKKIAFLSPVSSASVAAGNHSTVFNYYNMDSLYSYQEMTFTEAEPYKPNTYYIEVDGQKKLDSSASRQEGKKYYKRVVTNAISGTNYSLGELSFAEGVETRSIGNFSHAENGYREGPVSSGVYYPVIAVGESSHAEGRGGLSKSSFSVESMEKVGNNYDIKFDDPQKVRNLLKGFQNSDEAFGSICYIGAETAGGKYNIYPITSYSLTNTGGKIQISCTDDLKTSNPRVEVFCGAAYGEASHAEGRGTSAKGNYSHAEGKGSVAEGVNSHAEGFFTKAIGNNSHAEGGSQLDENKFTIAQGNNSHAEGYITSAIGSYSHSEGEGASATGKGSHAEGYFTIASGDYSHAEGGRDSAAHASEAAGKYSHVEGFFTNVLANAEAGHAEGYGTEVKHSYSHAAGKFTKTSREAQTVVGEYNENNEKAYFIVGGGSSDAPKNLFAVTKENDGNTGLILYSPNGHKWKVTIDNDGKLKSTDLGAT